MSGQFLHLKGFKELAQVLDTLPAKLQSNVMRGALRAGARIIADAAKANAPRVTGKYAASIGVSSRNKGGVVTASARTRDFRAIWLEFGTRPHTITAKNRKGLAVGGLFFQSVQHPGAKPKAHFIPAMDAHAGDAVVAAGRYMQERFTKAGIDAPDIDVGIDEETT